MAADKIFMCRSIDTGGGALLDGLWGRISPRPGPVTEDPGGAAAPGAAEIQRSSKNDLFVEVYSTDVGAVLALMDEAEGAVVFHYKGAAGANKKRTIKNVLFTEPIGDVEVPAPDGGGVIQAYGMRGKGIWESTDTWATMIVEAADV